MVSNAENHDGPYSEARVGKYKQRVKSTLGLLMRVLQQPTDEFESCVSAETIPGCHDAGVACAEDSILESGSAEACWHCLQGRQWWALERASVIAIISDKLVHDLMACHQQCGEVSLELQWVCQNLGRFIDRNEDLRGPAIAGLALAAEEFGEEGTQLPPDLAQMLRESIGEFAPASLGVAFG